MPEEAIKKRLRRAKTKVVTILTDIGYRIIPSDNSQFCLLGIRKNEIRMIRVVVDEITKHDIDLVKEFYHPGICSKEIWCRRFNEKGFKIQEIT